MKEENALIYHTTQIVVLNAKAEQFYDFMINPDNDRYREWFPNEHLAFYITKPGAINHLGDEVFYDEYLGSTRRLKFFADVITANRPTSAAWQMKLMRLRLPAVLSLELTDTPNGLQIDHELSIGFNGIGKVFDPIIRLYFTKSFSDALSKHCLEEWPRLGKYLTNQVAK